MNNVKIIAEAGVNHNGKEDLAIKLIDEAVESGADIIKFQTFQSTSLVSEVAKKADYQSKNINNSESQLEMLKGLELSQECFIKLKKYSTQKGIGFLSTAFDKESLDFLINTLGMSTLKIASGELTNAPLVLEHAKTKRDIILSTGMASNNEIQNALEMIAFGYTNERDLDPDALTVKKIIKSQEIQRILRKKVTLLHCTTRYPTPVEDTNLNSIDNLKNNFDLNIGFSDHTTSLLVPALSVLKGVKIIEKHFTIDTDLEGPDHKASLNPCQFKEMVTNIREAESALGNYEKTLTQEEKNNKKAGRRSLHVCKNVKKGEKFTKDNMTTLRPGNGISPFSYWDMLNKEAKRDYFSGELIDG